MALNFFYKRLQLWLLFFSEAALAPALEHDFDGLMVAEQGTRLTVEFRAVGRSLVPSVNPRHRPKKDTLSPRLSKAMKKVSLTQAELAERTVCQFKARKQLSGGDRKATKLFWEAVSRKKKRSTFIGALESGGEIVCKASAKARIIKDLFKTKDTSVDQGSSSLIAENYSYNLCRHLPF